VIESFKRSADEFCEWCDYPLFWAPAAVLETANSSASDGARRRLPSVGGHQSIGSRECRGCGELNALDATICWRCNIELDVPEAPRVIEVPDLPAPPPPIIDQPPWWRYLVLVVGVSTALAIAAAIIWA
jgi:hypothetical protein